LILEAPQRQVSYEFKIKASDINKKLSYRKQAALSIRENTKTSFYDEMLDLDICKIAEMA